MKAMLEGRIKGVTFAIGEIFLALIAQKSPIGSVDSRQALDLICADYGILSSDYPPVLAILMILSSTRMTKFHVAVQLLNLYPSNHP